MTHGNQGNKNAVKDDSKKSSGHINMRCLRADKVLWVKASVSAGMKLTEWIVAALNEKARPLSDRND